MASSTRFQNLKLQNFRCFENAEFQFGDQFNVIIGENGKGKSSILDALSLVIGKAVGIFAEPLVSFEIKDEDARKSLKRFENAPSTVESSYPVKISGILYYNELNNSFLLTRGDEQNLNAGGCLASLTIKLRNMLECNTHEPLSVFAYYHVARASKITAIRTKTRYPIASRAYGYSACLSANVSVADFSDWLEKITYISLQEGISSDLLEAVLDAIYRCLPEVQKIEFRVRDDALAISFNNGMTYRFNDLSDGFRSVLTLVADIAYRAATLNPHLKKDAMSQVPGVVLIDEIDIHLHPRWQRRIVGDLKRAFPAMQFIATTHSPFIIQSLEPDEVINLNHPDQSRQEYEKLSIEDIVEEIMGVPVPQRSKRYQDMYDAAKKYYALLEKTKSGDSSELGKIEDELNKLSAPFADDVAYTAFLDFKRAEAETLRQQEHANATR